MRVCCNAKSAEGTQRARRVFADFASEFFAIVALKTLAGLMHVRGISVTAMRGFQTCGRDVNALTGFMPGISSSIMPDAANVTTGRATVQAVQKAVIDFLLLFMMFSISRVSGHKNAAFAKDLHTDGSA